MIVDTLRADHLGAWGYDRPTSPNMDALAARGVRFDQYYSTCAWTRPAMASMLTGLYPRTTGVYEEKYDRLPDDLDTLAELLGRAGWHTLGLTSNPSLNEYFSFQQGFAEYGESDVIFKFMGKRQGYQRMNKEHPLEDAVSVTDRTLNMVDRHRSTLESEPLYLQVLYIDPHLPNQPSATHLAAVRGAGGRVGEYDAEIHLADQEIGRLLDGLEQRGLLDDALVVLTSDHGEGLVDHPGLRQSSGHGHYLYDSVLHVPLILAHPDLPQGLSVPALASTVDLVPTILELVDVPAPELPGRSLLPAVQGHEVREHAWFETDWRFSDKVGVRTLEHKLLRHPDAVAWHRDGTHEGRKLNKYDQQLLEMLPAEELHQPGTDVEHAPMAAQPTGEEPPYADLAAALQSWEAQHPRRPPEQRDPKDVLVLGDGTVIHTVDEEVEAPDEATTEQLRALGYLEDEP